VTSAHIPGWKVFSCLISCSFNSLHEDSWARRVSPLTNGSVSCHVSTQGVIVSSLMMWPSSRTSAIFPWRCVPR